MHEYLWRNILQENRQGVQLKESVWHTLSRWSERLASIFYMPTTGKKVNALMDIKAWLHKHLSDTEYEHFEQQIEQVKEKVKIEDKYGSPSEIEFDKMISQMLDKAKELKMQLVKERELPESIDLQVELDENINWSWITSAAKEKFMNAWTALKRIAKKDDDTKVVHDAETFLQRTQEEIDKVKKEYEEKLAQLNKKIKDEAESKNISLEKAKEDHRSLFQQLKVWYDFAITKPLKKIASWHDYIISVPLELLSGGLEDTVYDEDKPETVKKMEWERQRDAAYNAEKEKLARTYQMNIQAVRRTGYNIANRHALIKKQYLADIEELNNRYGIK